MVEQVLTEASGSPEVPATPDVSVVIPVYNTVAFLQTCVDSLLAQSLGADRIEVVAVDDGSTDGSGELLDDYAARHPEVVRVLHQANSGGPASPCNAGLEQSRGRYVFFLGSDDYLSPDALERSVRLADELSADVVIPPMAGVNGRYVDQRVFEAGRTELEFPGELLAYSLSNTKLFSKRLIDEHGLRYPLDLRVGSDQPFTVAAMLHARRIVVVPGQPAYFAVKRDDQTNVTYSTTWRQRLADVTAVVDHIAGIIAPGEARDALLLRHFNWEFDKLVRVTLPTLERSEAEALLEGLAAVLATYLTDGLSRRLTVQRRLRYWLVGRRRLDDLLAELARADQRAVIHLEDGGRAFYAHPGFRAPGEERVPDEVFVPHVESLRYGVQHALLEHTARLVDGRLEVSLEPRHLAPGSLPLVTFVLEPLEAGAEPRQGRAVSTSRLAAPDLSVAPELDGARLRGVLDLTTLLTSDASRWSVRVRVTHGPRTYDLPVRCGVDQTAAVKRRFRSRTAHLTTGPNDRVVIAFED